MTSPCANIFSFLHSTSPNLYYSRSPPLTTQTFLQSVIHLPTHPNPATSTTFSCQLRNTLIAEPLLSFAAPGLLPICENPDPVSCDVTCFVRAGVVAMPLYLLQCERGRREGRGILREWGRAGREGRTYRYFMRTSRASLPPSDRKIR
jgi:hypothetical protein